MPMIWLWPTLINRSSIHIFMIYVHIQVTFAPIRRGYSVGFQELVVQMLQKQPEARPSAYDLYTLRVPPLMQQEEEEVVEDTPPGDTRTIKYESSLESSPVSF